jgi:phosphoglycolate phosphatase
MFKPKLVLIDLDGTLVDSVPDLTYCVDEMMQALNMPPRGEAAVRTWVGNGVQRLTERALVNDLDGHPEPELLNKALPIFLALYAENTSKRSRLYDGVLEGLDYLQSCPDLIIGCVTNKAAQFTIPLLSNLGIYDRFKIVISGDSLAEKKPHPLPLLHAAETFGIDPSDALMIGDSKSDVKAARAAGFKIACLTYGYNHGEDIRKYEPDIVLDSLADIKRYIQLICLK